MQELLDWVTRNANALSGYVILLVVVVVFIWAMATSRIYVGKNVERILVDKDAQIAKCGADLMQCQRPPGGVP
jgi:uncharacterized membrane protein YqiK